MPSAVAEVISAKLAESGKAASLCRLSHLASVSEKYFHLERTHRGRSVRRARVCFAGTEYGLDPIAGGSIALTHLEHFVRSSELDMDLVGAEFAPGAGGGFSCAPRFRFGGGELGFVAVF